MQYFSNPRLIAAGILVYCVFLIAYLPAARVLALAPLPASVSLNGVSGTVWSGSIKRLSINGVGVDNVRWTLDALPLVWGTASLDVTGGKLRQTDAAAIDGHLSLRLGGIEARDLTLFVPATQVMAQVPLPVPVNADGRFKLTLTEAAFPARCDSLQGKGQWLSAGILLPNQRVALGNFDAALRCRGDDVLISIAEPNSFGLNADIAIAPNGRYQVAGRFKPSKELPEELRQTAQFFGQADSSGYYQIAF